VNRVKAGGKRLIEALKIQGGCEPDQGRKKKGDRGPRQFGEDGNTSRQEEKGV
jgi:hypothetical protein